MWGARRAVGNAARGQLSARRGAGGRRCEPGRARLGARHLCLHPLHEKKPGAARLVWPEGADRGLVERLAGGGVPRPRPGQHPGLRSRARRSWPTRRCAVAEAGRRAHRDHRRRRAAAPRTIRRSTRSAAPAPGAPRLVDIVWGDAGGAEGDAGRQGRVLRYRRARPQAGLRHAQHEEGHGRRGDRARRSARRSWRPGCKVRLRVLLPCVENAVSGNAMRPRDIIRTRKGLTVEIGNTDAEGRLILCDALAEASTEKPEMIVDIATLTGAARVALGPELPALFCNDDALAARRCSPPARPRTTRCGGCRCGALSPACSTARSPTSTTSPTGRRAARSPPRSTCRNSSSPAVPWAHLDVMAWNARSPPGRPEGAEAQTLRALYAHIAGRFG